ncbi:MAG: enoyl-CoA hydratase/isomerase family protein [Chloroflexi bacterium]|nr:enoyl-CoA hydratase/isomerase family protein [Chloroflexota bacterium]
METIIYEVKERVATLTLNRPESMNAMNSVMGREVSETLQDFRDDPDAWVLIITGAGDRAFSAGMDLKEFSQRQQGGGAVEARPRFLPRLQNATLEIWKPIIAAINGIAVGGGLELVMCSDIRIAAETARLGLMEVKRGIVPGSGGMFRLPRQVPVVMALEMLLTGDPIPAQEALRIGLINQVVPPAELMPAAHKMAERILSCAPLAVRKAKETLYRGLEMPLHHALVSSFGIDLNSTEDAKEGPKAFAEKRPAVWKGR